MVSPTIEVADGIRTRDHRDHNPGLYQLSYRHRAAGKGYRPSLADLLGGDLVPDELRDDGDDLRIELGAGAALELADGCVRRERLAVGTRGRPRVVRVADGDDAGRQRDRPTRDAVGIAGAVPALVRRADDVADPAQRRGGREDALADQSVLADEGPLVLREG